MAGMRGVDNRTLTGRQAYGRQRAGCFHQSIRQTQQRRYDRSPTHGRLGSLAVKFPPH
jgi:hypothetical protein